MLGDYEYPGDLRMVEQQSYLIHLDYGNRAEERRFVGAILDRFDRNVLIGANLFINNNPYGLELLLHLNFESGAMEFESWLKQNYPSKRREQRLLLDDISAAMAKRGYNQCGLVDSDMLELIMPSEANGFFLFPDKGLIEEVWGKASPRSAYTVFLSHSSRDKALVDRVFNALHGAEIRSWYDRYEIAPGDSITDKINEGLQASSLALLFISRSFLDSSSGWPTKEANYFFQQQMRKGHKNFIVLNVDVPLDELPPLLQDFRFIDMADPSAIEQVIDAVRKCS
ncbi:MAG: toll/interleukin-1 receptor domain-containing protein [Telluria sp.]